MSEPEETTPDDAREERLTVRRERTRKKRLKVAGIVAGVIVAVVVLAVGLGFAAAQLAAPPDRPPVMLTPDQMAAATTPPAVESTTTTVAAATTAMPDPVAASAAVTEPTAVPAPETGSDAPPAFDADRAMSTVAQFAATIGVRKGGSVAELRAEQYVMDKLRSYGYTPVIQSVTMPDGLVTHNVIVSRPGASPGNIVMGAHIDSKAPSPGGNDNASGAATILELARDISHTRLTPTVTFVWFGTEEMIDANPDHHHYGSREYVRRLTPSQKNRVAGMVSVDMVGVGDKLLVRSMGRGPQSMVDFVTRTFAASGNRPTYVKDSSKVGWSDHEPFELAGIPAVWVEWQSDPSYHTARDTAVHVDKNRIGQTGSLLLTMLQNTTVADLQTLWKR